LYIVWKFSLNKQGLAVYNIAVRKNWSHVKTETEPFKIGSR